MKVILEYAGPHMLPPVTLSTLLQDSEASKSENPAAFLILLQAGAHVGMDTQSLRIAIKLQHAEAMRTLIRAGTEV
uniref:Uncharacterized protein n=1 Tax=Chromera velia CCMP2878 TaxID=1169474 RepID=A0A0G4I8F9_9ALVE|eukprot:Cvel_11939.t1-p1 / transcript=Cvel_11939.t1 / gene=Cvel_11939 / organism=Chromera_velia_CCMP2878 / gene_product=hypothetical protein / transcript_product=hypothetical protein / location=Cvel_scaffold765:13737-13961(-) / protein_length=75 / sequence_SO=supercontig / SO=protein_coding / is_pseudo=false